MDLRPKMKSGMRTRLPLPFHFRQERRQRPPETQERMSQCPETTTLLLLPRGTVPEDVPEVRALAAIAIARAPTMLRPALVQPTEALTKARHSAISGFLQSQRWNHRLTIHNTLHKTTFMIENTRRRHFLFGIFRASGLTNQWSS